MGHQNFLRNFKLVKTNKENTFSNTEPNQLVEWLSLEIESFFKR